MPYHILLREAQCVGQYYLEPEDKLVADTIEFGTEVDIQHEADNQYDKFAAIVREKVTGAKIGYLRKEYSPAVVLFITLGFVVHGKITGRTNNKQNNPELDVWVEVPDAS